MLAGGRWVGVNTNERMLVAWYRGLSQVERVAINVWLTHDDEKLLAELRQKNAGLLKYEVKPSAKKQVT